MRNLIPNNEIALDNKADALEVAKILVKNEYVVMLSKEEELFVVNYINTSEYNEANRNGVVFMSREDFDAYYMECDSDGLD